MKDEQTTQQPAPKIHKEIHAQRFVLVDDNGQNRAELKFSRDESILVMHDAQGLMRLTLRAGAREVTLNIFGDRQYRKRPAEAIDLLSIGWEMGDQTPFFKIHDHNEETEVTTIRNLASTVDYEDEDVNEEEDEADDEGDGGSEAWDFSKPFTYEPNDEPTTEAEQGGLVLIRRGAGIAIVPYDGQQEYLGTIEEVAETWDLIKAEEDALLEQAAAAEQGAKAAPSNRFDVPSKFNELAERLAINLGDDELLGDLIRLAFAIASEPDYLSREMLALTVANQAYTRTCEFSRALDSILGDAQPA